MLGVPEGVVGQPLGEVLTLRDQEDHAWTTHNRPYDGLPTRTAVPEQSWLLPNGEEVLVAARIHRPALHEPVSEVAVTIRSGRGRARLDRERSDLVATVAHELRSPLTGVKGFVQALLNRWDKLNDEQKKLMLTTVSADSDRLSRLIAELLDVARIDTGRLQLHQRPCDAGLLDPPDRRVGRRRHRPADRGRHRRRPPRHPRRPRQVHPGRHQPGRERRAPRRGHRQGRGCEPLRPGDLGDQTGVRITVDDQGEGIPKDLRRRVFTKFWKGGKRGGSGLGLYIVGGLTKVHGGTSPSTTHPAGERGSRSPGPRRSPTCDAGLTSADGAGRAPCRRRP